MRPLKVTQQKKMISNLATTAANGPQTQPMNRTMLEMGSIAPRLVGEPHVLRAQSSISSRCISRMDRKVALLAVFFFLSVSAMLSAQVAPYVNLLPAEPPYYRIRYEGSSHSGELVYPVSYTIWIPPGLKTLRGLIVHQHGCGEGSCKSGQTGAFDLHWQALAKKHGCGLMGPMYEQPDKANCQLWCDPRNGSDVVFQKSLQDLGKLSNHPELATVPWAMWGHSGGGHWAGGMLLLHPERVAAAWLRSGVPPLRAAEGKPTPYPVSGEACQVPVMCNLGTQEGVTVKDGRFSGVWGGVESFFKELRSQGGLVGVAVDPLTSHECGNQRYLAIPWLDACLSVRLPEKTGDPLNRMSSADAWVAPLDLERAKAEEPVPSSNFKGVLNESIWLPNESVAKAWKQYIHDTAVTDLSPPPAPKNLSLKGTELTWESEADLESGIANFIIERDGQFLANVPEKGKNPFGRPIFQNLQYSDTPSQPLIQMRYQDDQTASGKAHQYRVIAVNTVGLKSPSSATISREVSVSGAAGIPSPIAHWKLDDQGLEARDSIGKHHGEIHGAVSHEGKIGKALLFDRAKGDHVRIPHATEFEIGTFTVSAWVWLTKEPTFSGILGSRDGGEFNFDMKVNADKVHGDIGDGSRWIETRVNFYQDDVGSNGQGGDLATQRWYLVTFAIDNERKECRLYLDGDRKKTIPFTGEPRLMRQGQSLQIGNTGKGEFMDGVIDDVQIWAHALSDEQVKRLPMR
jgi:hypothetical protein